MKITITNENYIDLQFQAWMKLHLHHLVAGSTVQLLTKKGKVLAEAKCQLAVDTAKHRVSIDGLRLPILKSGKAHRCLVESWDGLAAVEVPAIQGYTFNRNGWCLVMNNIHVSKSDTSVDINIAFGFGL